MIDIFHYALSNIDIDYILVNFCSNAQRTWLFVDNLPVIGEEGVFSPVSGSAENEWVYLWNWSGWPKNGINIEMTFRYTSILIFSSSNNPKKYFLLIGIIVYENFSWVCLNATGLCTRPFDLISFKYYAMKKYNFTILDMLFAIWTYFLNYFNNITILIKISNNLSFIFSFQFK